jgi:hypothetical protein
MGEDGMSWVLKMLGPLSVICSKFHHGDPKIFCTTVQNVVARGNLAHGICAPLLYHVFPQLLQCVYN